MNGIFRYLEGITVEGKLLFSVFLLQRVRLLESKKGETEEIETEEYFSCNHTSAWIIDI